MDTFVSQKEDELHDKEDKKIVMKNEDGSYHDNVRMVLAGLEVAVEKLSRVQIFWKLN